MNEATRLRLLGDLIDAVQDHNRPHSDLDHLYVHFFTKRGRLVTDELSIPRALDCLFNDVHRFADFDLTDAHRLEVHLH